MRVFHWSGTEYLVYVRKTNEVRIVDEIKLDQEIADLEAMIDELDIMDDKVALYNWAKTNYPETVGLPQAQQRLATLMTLKGKIEEVKR